MPTAPKIGQYRHTAAPEFQPGPGGRLVPTRVRRRFPLRGLVLLAYGVLGPLACAAVSLLLGAGGQRFLPQQAEKVPLPPPPAMENLLFRVGLPEIVLVSALAGALLWRALWKVRIPPEAQALGVWEAFRRLISQGLILGPVFALAMLPPALYGFCVRGAPSDVPVAARFLFAIPGTLVLTVSYLATGVVPLVVVVLGLLMGVGTALGVAALWQHYPEEPLNR